MGPYEGSIYLYKVSSAFQVPHLIPTTALQEVPYRIYHHEHRPLCATVYSANLLATSSFACNFACVQDGGVFVLCSAGMEPGASCMLGRRSTTELHPCSHHLIYHCVFIIGNSQLMLQNVGSGVRLPRVKFLI